MAVFGCFWLFLAVFGLFPDRPWANLNDLLCGELNGGILKLQKRKYLRSTCTRQMQPKNAAFCCFELILCAFNLRSFQEGCCTPCRFRLMPNQAGFCKIHTCPARWNHTAARASTPFANSRINHTRDFFFFFFFFFFFKGEENEIWIEIVLHNGTDATDDSKLLNARRHASPPLGLTTNAIYFEKSILAENRGNLLLSTEHCISLEDVLNWSRRRGCSYARCRECV